MIYDLLTDQSLDKSIEHAHLSVPPLVDHLSLKKSIGLGRCGVTLETLCDV